MRTRNHMKNKKLNNSNFWDAFLLPICSEVWVRSSCKDVWPNFTSHILKSITAVISMFFWTCNPLAADAKGEQACAAVPGNSYWTADEILYAQNLRFMVGKEVVLPSAPGALDIKYQRCLREIDDATAFNAHEVMQIYEDITGWSNSTSKLGAIALGMLVPADAALGGWLTKKAIGESVSSLARHINGGSATEIEGLITNMLLQEIKVKPNASPQEILTLLDRIKNKIKSDTGYSTLDASTLRLLDSAAIVAMSRLAEVRQRGQDISQIQEPYKDSEAKTKIKKFEADLRERNKRITSAQSAAGQAAAAAGIHIQSSNQKNADWNSLRERRQKLVERIGTAEADSALAEASKDPEALRNLAETLQLSNHETQILADDAHTRLELKKLSDDVKLRTKVISEMATLAENIGWNEGATSFAAAVKAAGDFSFLLDGLASFVGPPTPLQGLQMANSMFSLAGSLSSAFGSRKSTDDGLGNAIKQILSGLKAINDQLAQMRKEQREHFAYAERHLEILVELAASEQWAGLDSCRSALAELSAFTAVTGITELRTALAESLFPDADARSCASWLMQPNVSPITFDGHDVRPVYKQLVSTGAKVAGAHAPLVAELKNQNFEEAEKSFPLLRSLLDDKDATGLLEPRTRWSGPSTFAVDDIGERLKAAGRNVGQTWKVSDLTHQMLSTPTVLQTAKAAIVLRPAASMLLPDSSGVASNDQSDRKHINFRNNILGAQFAISLVALAQENLLSGALLADHIDILLDEADQREALAKLISCRKLAPMAICLMRADLEQLPVVAGCDYQTGDPAAKCLSCPEKPNPSASTMCSRFGKQAFERRVASARASLLAFPTLRQNVLGARMWRLADRRTHHEHWMPRYSWAMAYVESVDHNQDKATLAKSNEQGLLALRKLFPTMNVRSLGNAKPDDAIIDGYLTSGTFFTRLAGQCEGISERAQLGISECSGGNCEFIVAETRQGRLHLQKRETGILREPGQRSRENVCVMAALPSAPAFGEGLLWQTEGAGRLRKIVEQMSVMLAIERAYDELKEPSQKWRLLGARNAQQQMQTTLEIEGEVHVR